MRSLRIVWTALPIVGACSMLAMAVAAQRPTLIVPETPVEAGRLAAHVKELASDAYEGRAPASPAERKTVDYIVNQLTVAGVRSGGESDGRGGRAWTQDVPLAQAAIIGPVRAGISVAGTAVPLRQGDDIAVRATMLPIDRVSIQAAPLVFVGYGISAPERDWDDFKGVDLHGKVGIVLVNDPDFETDLGGRFGGPAMTYYGRWTYKYEEAARRGALGMLVVHETAPASYGWNTVKSSNTTTMFDIVRANPAETHPLLEGWVQRAVAVDLFRRAGLDFVAEKKKAQAPSFKPLALPSATISLDYAVNHEQVRSKNVVARVEGTLHPDETVIYTSHWDHLGIGEPDASGDRIYNGARDNALGVAALLELSRVYAAAPRPERSVVFLFVTAEEKGLLGSEYYAQHPLYPLATTVAVLNMDGGSSAPTRDVAIAGDGRVSLQENLAAAAKLQGRRISPDPRPEAGSFFRSDHFSFAKVGVPAISFRAGQDRVDGGVAAGKAAAEDYNSRHYHQPSDEWSADWDLRGEVTDLGLLYAIGRDLAGSRKWPVWQPGSEFKSIRDASASSRR